jgi:hypothetical protein
MPELRPSTVRVVVRSSCFTPAIKSGVHFEGALRDQFSIAVMRCGHNHPTKEEALPCAGRMYTELYSKELRILPQEGE